MENNSPFAHPNNGQSIFAALRDALAELYPAENDARVVVSDTGLNAKQIAFSARAQTNWQHILTEAVHQDRLDELLSIVSSTYGNNPRLQEAHTQYTLFILQGGHITPAAENESPTFGESPYKGLQFFDVGDASVFYGREQLTAELVTALRHERFLAIVGASGSGKSSLVRAGLVASLQRGSVPGVAVTMPNGCQHWPVYLLTPGVRPLESLAASLTQHVESVTATSTLIDNLRDDSRSLHLYVSRLLSGTPAKQLLLVVDQFEELFTLCRDVNEQRAFVDALLTAALDYDRTIVVMALRADFYASCARFEKLRAVLDKSQKYIGLMNRPELQRAIEAPATQGRWTLEPGLMEQMLDDVSDEPGHLPLLSHALDETWKRRRGRQLTLAGYVAAGGVKGAIAQTADATYRGFSPEQQVVVRAIFLRLTELGEGVQDTRRRVALDELQFQRIDPQQVSVVLTALADARLVTTDAGEVQLMHEAIISEWPLLREWLDEDREGLRIQRRLTEAAQDWQGQGRDIDLLYRGTRLQQAVAWADKQPAQLNALEQGFLKTSQAHVLVEEQKREEARQRELAQQRALSRRLGWLAAAVTTIMILAVVASLWINRERIRADTNANEARSQQLVAQAQTAQQTSNLLERSMLLALEALPSTASRQAEEVLRQGLTLLPLPMLRISHDDTVTKVAFSPNGKWVASASQDRTVQIYSVETEKAVMPAFIHSGSVYGLAFSPNGQQLATGTGTGEVYLWALDNGREITHVTLGGEVYSVTFSPDGQWLAAASSNGIARIWATKTQQELTSISHTARVNKVAFRFDSRWIATASNDGVVTVWDLTENKKVIDLRHEGQVFQATFSPDGAQLATATSDFNAYLWNIASGKITARLHHNNWVEAVAFSPDGAQLATASDDYTVRLWEVASGLERLRLPHDDVVNTVSFDATGKRIASASNDHTARVWNAASGQEVVRLIHDDGVNDVVFDPTDKHLATASADHSARVWEYTDPSLRALRHNTIIWDIAFSPDGHQLATASDDEFTAWLWDVGHAEAPPVLLPTHGKPLQALAISPEGQWLATGGTDRRAYLVQLANQTELPAIEHIETILALAFHRNGKWLATGSVDDGVRVWDMTAKLQVTPIYAYYADDDVTDLDFASQHPWLASAGGSASVYDILQKKLVQEVKHEGSKILAVAFHPAETMLATGGADGSARLWNLATGSEVMRLLHNGAVNTVVFSPDGQWLATGSADRLVRLWDVASGQEVIRLQHQGPVKKVVFSANGQRLASTSNNVAQLWNFEQLSRVDKSTLATTVCAHLTRNLTAAEWRQYFEDKVYRLTCPNLPALENVAVVP